MSQIIYRQSYVSLIVPDSIVESMIIEQYTYVVYANYDVILQMDEKRNVNIPEHCEEKDILIFLHMYRKDTLLLLRDSFEGYKNINFVIFCNKAMFEQIPIVFSVSEEIAHIYIDYLIEEFPQIITSKSDKDIMIKICGYSFYNIYHMMQLCYFNHILPKQINKYNFIEKRYLDIEEDERFIYIIGLSTVGIHTKLAENILEKEKIEYYIKKQYLFQNAEYIIPNICLHLQYREYWKISFFDLWDKFDNYIEELVDDYDQTIVTQTVWILQKTLKHMNETSTVLDNIIFRIEGRLHKLFRFILNDELLELERLCKQYFNRDKLKTVYLTVNEAILYEDIEKYDVAQQKFDFALEMCSKLNNTETYMYVIDEYSRLLQKTGQYKEALKQLYIVENFYQIKENSDKLRNIRNRIGINLSFIGNIKEATNYLEKIHFGDFNGKIDVSEVLSCEVANNLSICYMESGDYIAALKLQDELYKAYKIVKEAPINYATDILQNKGNVFLFQHNYKEATQCFEVALYDETNPISKELILENYLYAKAMWENDYDDTIVFFKNQVAQKEDNETEKMLAELYYAGGFYKECCLLCEKIMNNITYEQNEILFILVNILLIKSRFKVNKLTLFERMQAGIRLNKYQKYIVDNIGEKSPYYEEFLKGKEVLAKKSECK